MSQKYKITSVSEPANALEEQRVKDCKSFNRAITKLVASSISEVIGGALMPYAMQMGSYAPIAAAFSAALIMVSGQFQVSAITKLQDLYNKKGNEERLDEENDLGGRTRWVKKKT